MEELDEDKIVAMADEYAESRMQFFKPWEGSYRLACKNAFVNAFVAGWNSKTKQIDPDFIIPEEPKDNNVNDYTNEENI
jgi:hypothetical protein